MGFFQNTQKPQGLGGKLMVCMMNMGHSAMANWGLSRLKTKDDWRVLDVGCGGGANVKRLLKRCHHVTGLDFSEISVAKSRRVNETAIRMGRCVIAQGDVSDMLFAKDRFDLVTAFETVYFWPGPEQSFAEVYRVLKPGGTFFICNEMDGANRWEKKISGMKTYTPEELTAKLAVVGFADIHIERAEKKRWFCLYAVKGAENEQGRTIGTPTPE